MQVWGRVLLTQALPIAISTREYAYTFGFQIDKSTPLFCHHIDPLINSYYKSNGDATRLVIINGVLELWEVIHNDDGLAIGTTT